MAERYGRRDFIRWGVAGLATLAWPLRRVLGAAHPTTHGVDVCPFCNMTVIDLRFSAQVVTPTGVVHHYDAVECLADHLNGHGPPAPSVLEVYLSDRAVSSREAASYLAADEALVAYHPRLRTPMAGGLAAFADVDSAAVVLEELRLADAELLTWEEVLARGEDHPWVPGY